MKIKKAFLLLSIIGVLPLFLCSMNKFDQSEIRTTFWDAIHTKKTEIIKNIFNGYINEQNQSEWEFDINDALIVVVGGGLNDILALILGYAIAKKLINAKSAYAALVYAVKSHHYNAAEMLLKEDLICAKFLANDIESIIHIAQKDWPPYLISLLKTILANKLKN